MGLTRTLLALAVLLSHSNDPLGWATMVSGSTAVQAFYIVSGFYMALVLSERYGANVRAFYAARALRIFPMYWLVLTATLVLLGWAGLQQVSDAARAALLLSTMSIIGQDAMRIAGFDHTTLPVPQAWTLAIELEFYLLAPFLARLRLRWLIATGLAFLALRQSALYLSWAGSWHYFALPFQLGLFVLGMVSYRIGKLLPKAPAWAGAIALTVVIGLIFHGEMPRVSTALFGVLAVAMPAIFALTRLSSIDAWLGELCYPLYLSHLLVIALIPGWGLSAYVVFSTLASLAIIAATYPIERMRIRIARPMSIDNSQRNYARDDGPAVGRTNGDHAHPRRASTLD